MVKLPSQKDFYIPTLRAYQNLGGAVRNTDMCEEVARIMNLTNEQRALPHNHNKYQYINRALWAKTHLYKIGMLVQVRRGYYALTEKGRAGIHGDPDQMQRESNNYDKMKKERKVKPPEPSLQNDVIDRLIMPESPVPEFDFPQSSTQQNKPTANLPSEDVKPPEVQPDPIKSSPISPIESIISSYSYWKDELLDTLRQMPSKRFARFIRQILQKSGLSKIEVIRSDDSTCEGIAEMGGGLMSPTRVHFRCLRGNRQIISEDVINFRREVGMSRAVQGMLIALGEFTKEAEREAERISSPMIDLIGGENLAAKLKELEFGVKSEIVRVERVTVDAEFFNSI